ncbi:regulatory protein [Escherichia coli]|nr:regulatory protein [Escherichia coli]
MHEFLVRIRAQLLWAWARLDEAEASARSGIEVLSSYQPTATASVPGNVDSMLAGPW